MIFAVENICVSPRSDENPEIKYGSLGTHIRGENNCVVNPSTMHIFKSFVVFATKPSQKQYSNTVKYSTLIIPSYGKLGDSNIPVITRKIITYARFQHDNNFNEK